MKFTFPYNEENNFFSRLPLHIMKTKVKKSLNALELENVVSRKDGYQEIINLIAKVRHKINPCSIEFMSQNPFCVWGSSVVWY